jgi:shikimate kinase
MQASAGTPHVVHGGRNIVLVGFMGTGKTSVGRCLAERLGYAFVDVDDLITAEAGMPIPRIFDEQGESVFRHLETLMVARAAGMPRTVVATGGGAVVNPVNLQRMQSCGVVIALTADSDTILARVGADAGTSRPMLQGDAPARIRSLLVARADAYARADVMIDTSRATIADVVDQILRLATPARLTGVAKV